MPFHRIPRPSPAMAVAFLALAVALGGTAFAHGDRASTAKAKAKARKVLVAKNSVGSAQVIDGSLLLKDFKASQRSRLVGPRGPQGLRGTTGATGTVDTSNFFTKTQSDARYLAAGAQAVDSAALGGVPASGYTTGAGAQGGRFQEMTNGQSDGSWLQVPGVGSLSVSCAVGANTVVSWSLVEGPGTAYYMEDMFQEGALPSSDAGVLNSQQPQGPDHITQVNPDGAQAVIQEVGGIGTATQTLATIELSMSPSKEAAGGCWVFGHYTTSRVTA